MIRSVFDLALGETSFEVQKCNTAHNGLLCSPLPQELVNIILPRLTHFIVDLRMDDALRAFNEVCPALLSLSLNFDGKNDYVRRALRKFSIGAGNLRRLELMGNELGAEEIRALENFGGIRELRLEVRIYKSHLGGVWRKLGGGLRKLHIDDLVHPKSLARTAWKNFVVPHLEELSVTTGILLHFLERAWSLRRVSLVASLAKIMTLAIPFDQLNVEVSATFYPLPMRFMCVDIFFLRDRLRRANFRITDAREGCTIRLIRCKNLEEVTIRGNGRGSARALSDLLSRVQGSRPLRHLHYLAELPDREMRADRVNALSYLAEHATMLETLVFHADDASMLKFEQVAVNNQQLNSVLIVIQEPLTEPLCVERAVKDAVTVFIAFLRCPKMKSVMLDDIRWSGWNDKVADVCRAHRRTYVDVFVNGISYRTGIHQ